MEVFSLSSIQYSKKVYFYFIYIAPELWGSLNPDQM